MQVEPLHEEFRAAGFRQGDVIAPILSTVAYDPARIALPLARSHHEREQTTSWPSFATGQFGKTFGAVITSHDCDLDRSPVQTPTLEVMRVLQPDDDFVRRIRGGIRYFVLSEDPRLVVEAQARALVDKPALLSLERAFRPDSATRVRFQSWLAQQYERPAFPQDVVDNVCSPIRESIAQHRANPATDSFYRSLRSVAIIPPVAADYYRVELLLTMLSATGQEEVAAGLMADIADRLRGTGKAELTTWRLVQPETIALADFESHHVVFADD